MLQAPPSQLKVKAPMTGLQWSFLQLVMLLLMAVISLQKMKKVVRQEYLWKGPREIMSRSMAQP